MGTLPVKVAHAFQEVLAKKIQFQRKVITYNKDTNSRTYPRIYTLTPNF